MRKAKLSTGNDSHKVRIKTIVQVFPRLYCICLETYPFKKEKKSYLHSDQISQQEKKEPLAVLACQPHFNPLDPQNAGYNSSNL